MQDEQVRLIIEEVQEHAAAMKQLSRCAKLQAGHPSAYNLWLLYLLQTEIQSFSCSHAHQADIIL